MSLAQVLHTAKLRWQREAKEGQHPCLPIRLPFLGLSAIALKKQELGHLSYLSILTPGCLSPEVTQKVCPWNSFSNLIQLKTTQSSGRF